VEQDWIQTGIDFFLDVIYQHWVSVTNCIANVSEESGFAEFDH